MVQQTKILGNNMKNILRLIATVSSILTVFSCNKEIDKPIDQPSEPETYTLSISASKGEFTKGLELSGDALNAIWDGTEEVYVFKNDAQIGVLTPDISTLVYPEKVSCTLSGPFTTVPEAGDVLTLKLTSNNYSGQDGTLDFIAGHCDYAVATLNVTGVNNGQIESTEGSANFENQQAIVKFTLKDKADDTTLLTPTTLTVNDGTSDIATATIPAATYTTNGSGVLYVAIPPVAGKTLTLTATVGAYDYVYTKDAATFVQGQYYTISVKMQRKVNISSISGDFEAQNGDILTGDFYHDDTYSFSIAYDATVTLHNAVIENKRRAGLEPKGNCVIILEGNNSIFGGTFYPGLSAPGHTLTIKGNGMLKVTGGNEAPGIGGGNIRIEDGNITATGGIYAAGIGGGYYGGCGDITIKGGNVTAIGSDYAAGIGGGYYGGCGNITISGGNVTATGGVNSEGIGVNAAGIGGGFYGGCGDITISGGNVTATGVEGAAGIGSGKDSNCGDIIIEDLVTRVTAIKGINAPNCIGPGLNGSCGDIAFGDIYNYVYTYGTGAEREWIYNIEDGFEWGGLHLTMSTTIRENDTWTLTQL